MVLAVLTRAPLDRLLDPVAGVGAEARVHRRVEALDGPQQAEVALLDQVLQAQPLAGVAAGDVDDQAQVGAHHAVAGLAVAVLDPVGELLLLVRVEQRRLVDLAQVGLQRRLDRYRSATAWSCHGDVFQRTGRSSLYHTLVQVSGGSQQARVDFAAAAHSGRDGSYAVQLHKDLYRPHDRANWNGRGNRGILRRFSPRHDTANPPYPN